MTGGGLQLIVAITAKCDGFLALGPLTLDPGRAYNGAAFPAL
jgi:hypothetical protein